jgi:hypothetical protein
VQIHEASNGVQVFPAVKLGHVVSGCNWSPDDRWFALILADRTATVLNVQDPQAPPLTIDIEMNPVAVVLSDAAEWLVISSFEGEVRAWHNGQFAWKTSAHLSIVRCMNLTLDQQQIICGGRDGITRLELATGQLIRQQ